MPLQQSCYPVSCEMRNVSINAAVLCRVYILRLFQINEIGIRSKVLKSGQRKPKYLEKYVPHCQIFHHSPSLTRNLLGWNRNLRYEQLANLLSLNITDMRILKYGRVPVRTMVYVRQGTWSKNFPKLGAISKL